MRSYFGFLAFINATQYLVNEEFGTVFEETFESHMFYTEIELDINLEVFSPRFLLNYEKYGECNEQLKLSNGDGFCTKQFDIYDAGIKKFVNYDILAHNNESPKFKQENEQQTTEITIDTKKQHKNNTRIIEIPLLKRKKRVVGAIVAGTVYIGTAISSYFIGKALTQKSTDEINQKITFNEQALFNLTKQVNITTENLVELEEILKANMEIVMSGSTELEWKTRFEAGRYYEEYKKSINNGYQMEIKIMDVLHISEVADKKLIQFKNWILSLQTGKIPMESDFILAIQAKCLSVQKSKNSVSNNFCHNFALKSTTNTEMVNFQGLGFTYFEETGKFKKSIKSSILRFSFKVPILKSENTTRLMKILNLGKIQPDNTLLMVDLPKYAIRKRGQIYPLDIKECQKYGDLEVCRWPSFLHFDFCLSSIYNKTIQERCNLIQKMNNSTCEVLYAEHVAIIALAEESTSYVQFKETLVKSRKIRKFDIVNYQNKELVVKCPDGQQIKVPAIKRHLVKEIQVYNLSSISEIRVHKQSKDDQFSRLVNKLQKNQIAISNQISNHKNLLNNFIKTNSSMKYMEESAKNGLYLIEEKIGKVWNKVERYVFWMGFSVIGTLLVAYILWKISCFALRFQKSKNTNAHIRLLREPPKNLAV
jgi:hypothetical protein